MIVAASSDVMTHRHRPHKIPRVSVHIPIPMKTYFPSYIPTSNSTYYIKSSLAQDGRAVAHSKVTRRFTLSPDRALAANIREYNGPLIPLDYLARLFAQIRVLCRSNLLFHLSPQRLSVSLAPAPRSQHHYFTLPSICPGDNFAILWPNFRRVAINSSNAGTGADWYEYGTLEHYRRALSAAAGRGGAVGINWMQ